jgi:predicted N-acyltransferase
LKENKLKGYFEILKGKKRKSRRREKKKGIKKGLSVLNQKLVCHMLLHNEEDVEMI